jgi:hypothetical protein
MVVRSSSPDVVTREPTPSPPGLTSPAGLLALASAGALCVAFALPANDAAHGPVVCPFRLATGLPCPGCGLTRAWVFLAHGRVGDAVSANPFGLITMPVAVAFVLGFVVAWVRRGPAPDLTRIGRSWIAKAVVTAWLVFAIARLGAVATGHAST